MPELEDKLRSLALGQAEPLAPSGPSFRWRGATKLFAVFVLVAGVALVPQMWANRNTGEAAGMSLEQMPSAIREPTRESVPAASALFASGYVVAEVEATVAAETTGRVVQILVDEGDFVKEGELTAVLDDSVLAVEREGVLLQERLVRISAQTLRLELEEALRVQAREAEMAAKGLGSESALSEARTRVAVLSSRIKEKEVELEAAEARSRLMDEKLMQYRVMSPFSGVVTRKNAQLGEIISPVSGGGGFTRTGLYTIVDMDSLIVEVDVNESFLSQIHAGQAATVTLDAYPTERFEARVKNVLPVVSRERASVRVQLVFTEKRRELMPGMAAKVSFGR